MTTERTILERASGHDPDDGDDESDTTQDTRVLADTPTLSAKSTRIGGEETDLMDSLTGPTFSDTGQALTGNKGEPRPRVFWTARQLGQTPPMQLIKDTVTQQLTGGQVQVTAPDDELTGPAEDVAALIEDIYQGPHHQDMSFDNLIAATVSDLIDYAFAYWEIRPSDNGEFPVAAFKPLPPLQVQHETDDDGDMGTDPAYWWVPYRRQGNVINTSGDARGLDKEQVVTMRHPTGTRSDRLYDESIATKVREYLELITDVDVHQKRHYSDSQLPAGFLHFQGSTNKDLSDIEDDIIEASGDPHDLVTVSSDDKVSWIPVGESVVDLEAIQEQQWYFKLVLAAAGLNQSEINVVEDGGFAKELPAWNRMTYKKVTKPMESAIFDPQNNHVKDLILGGFDTQIDTRLQIGLERFDPIQEQIEREETLDEWREKAVSLNELRGGIGREAQEFAVDIPELGGEVNLADVPRYVVDLILDDTPNVTIDDEGNVNQESQEGPPAHDDYPVLSAEEAFRELNHTYDERVEKQLDDTIDVQSSFIQSTAFSGDDNDVGNFMQITFDAPEGSATYWYSQVERFRFFNFLRSSSKGSYFNKYIRHTGVNNYPFVRVD